MGKIIRPKLVALVNKTNTPVTIRYKDRAIIIPGKGSTKKEFVREHLAGIDTNKLMLR